MRRDRRTILATAAAAMVVIVSIAGATTATATPGGHHGRGPVASLVADGTVTQAQLDALKVALETARDSAHAAQDAARKAALAPLVTAGTITQAQADALLADRHGMHGLDEDGTLTDAQVKAVHDALKPLKQTGQAQRATILDTALASLVTAGTITQVQADAIKAATPFGQGGKRGHGHMGGHR